MEGGRKYRDDGGLEWEMCVGTSDTCVTCEDCTGDGERDEHLLR